MHVLMKKKVSEMELKGKVLIGIGIVVLVIALYFSHSYVYDDGLETGRIEGANYMQMVIAQNIVSDINEYGYTQMQIGDNKYVLQSVQIEQPEE